MVSNRFKMSGLILLPLLLLSAITVQAENKYRLPENAKPIKYNITLEPDLQKFTFSGSVEITVTITQNTDTLTLNQKDIEITNITIEPMKIGIIKSIPNNDLEFQTILFNDTLTMGKEYKLTITYNALLNDIKRGFYRSRYLDKENNIKYIATTHFEPTGARMAFPCWDEPAYKAKFTINLIHLRNYTSVISNMNQNGTTDKFGDKVITRFNESPLMSSYLVAFVVSDYGKTESDNKKYRVYTKPHAVNQTRYALEFGEKVIQQLDNYTNIKYFERMDKMDQISIKDFTAGAMENWGLVTYRETALLYEEGVTTTRSKQSIATIIAHEFAHQWFGNLVSPKWWEYIWLNEGFANYFQYFITDKLVPEWRLMELYVVEALQGSAFVADAKANSRPMNQAVDSPSEISNLFDNIAYQKAGSVIRMMSHILSEEVFQKRLQEYLKEFSLKVAESKNLIERLQTAPIAGTTTPLSTIIDAWINKPGYPVVTIKKNGAGALQISQEQFLLYGTNKATKWWVPLTYVEEKNPDFNNTKITEWLKPNEDLIIKNIDKNGWFIFNTQHAGYYRVNYDVENWERLTAFLQKKDYTKIHPVNRAQLIDDALNMARTNRLNYTIALTLSLYLNRETDYIPWTSAFRNLNFFHNMLYTSKHYAMFKSYVQYILEGVTKQVTYKPMKTDIDVTKLLRTNIMKWACKVDIQECIKYAQEEFKKWFANSIHYRLDPDLKSNILCYGLKYSDLDTWNKTLNILAKTTADKDERNTLLAVMGCSNSTSILKQFLEQSLEKDSPIDFEVAVQAVMANNQLEGFDLVLSTLIMQLENIKKLENSEDKIKSCIDTLGNAVVTIDQYLRLSTFTTKIDAKAELVQTTVQKSTRNIDWIESYGAVVENWLHHNPTRHNSAGTIALTSFLFVILSFFVTQFY